MTGPLEGIRVADFSHVIAGPFCAMILGDMGAEVIKIEPPEGDGSRAYMQLPELDGESSVYISYNRNKQGIVLDLSQEAGRQVAREIVASADVLVENFASGVMQRLGLDYASMGKTNARLIYCSISAYGRDGGFARRAAYDPVVQAESGFMSLNGFPDRESLRTPLPMIDITTGMFAAQAVLAALHARNMSGRGQYLEVSLFDNAFALTSFFTVNYLLTGKSQQRVGNKSVMAAPADLFEAADGKFYLSVASERVWRKFLTALGNPPKLQGEEFCCNSARMKHELQLKKILQRIFLRAPLADWLPKLQAAGVPCGPIRSVAEAVNSPEVKDRNILGKAAHGTLGEVPNLRLPLKMAGTPLIASRGAPALGEHTNAVLSKLLNYGPARIAELISAGVIKSRDPRTTRDAMTK